MEPQVGNIRLTDGTLIGYRDPDTGVFTPDVAFPDVEFVEDKSCNTSCNYSTYFNGVENIDVPFVYNFEVDAWNPNTGPSKFDGNYPQQIRSGGVDMITDGTIENFKYTLGSGYIDDAYIFAFGVDNADRIYCVHDLTFNRIRLFVYVGGILKAARSSPGSVVFEGQYYRFELVINSTDLVSAKKIRVDAYDADDVLITTTTDYVTDFTGFKLFTKFNLLSDFDEIFQMTADVHSHTSTTMGDSFFTTRLREEDSADYYKVLTDSAEKWTIIPTDPTGSDVFYPNYTYPTSLIPTGTFNLGIMGDSLSDNILSSSDWIYHAKAYYDYIGVTDINYINNAQGGAKSYRYAPTSPTPVLTGGTNYAPPDTGINSTSLIASGIHLGIWFLGQNDNTAGFDLTESEDVLDAVINEFAVAGIPLIIFTAMPRDITEPTEVAWSNSFSATVRTKASANVKVVDPNILLGLNGSPNYRDATYFADLYHTNLPGAQRLTSGDPTLPLDDTMRGITDRIDEFFPTLPNLVSDTTCTVTSGQQQLQIIQPAGIAQVIDGKFQFILVP